MASAKQIFNKAGGINTIINYARAGVLPYMIGQVLLTGKSSTSLELMRNGVQMKIKNRLRKQYIDELKKFDASYDAEAFPMQKSKKVWVCWMQGMDKAPTMVQRCYRSLQENFKDRELVLLTEENLLHYVQIPDFIMEKLHKGIITRTHFSDILRVELLIQHGGTWIDATVFCSGNIPVYMMEDEFFIFQKVKPGSDGSAINMSSWFMSTWSNQKFLLATRELLYAYWRKNNRMIDYFLLHLFMMIVKDYYLDEWQRKIIPYPNSLPHVVQLMLFEKFDQRRWDAACASSPFHKLTYKVKDNDISKAGTYYKFIMEN